MNCRSKIKIIWGFVICLSILLSIPAQVFSHSGHDHEDGPSITLPEVLAQVNGTDIKKEDIWADLKRSVKRYKARGMALTNEQEKIAAKKLLDNEIYFNLLLQKAQEMKISVPTQKVDSQIESIRKKFKSEEAFLKKLESQSLTLETYKKQLADDFLANAVLEKEVGASIEITDEILKNYYEKNKTRFTRPEQRRASVILVKIKGKDEVEAEKKALSIIQNIQAELKKGTGFSDLAKEFSQDSLAKKGGDLGLFTKDHMFKPFAEKAFKLKVGEVTNVFRSKHGLHLLKLTGIVEGSKGGFDAEKENIRKSFLQEEIKKKKKPYLDALRKEAKVKVYF